MVDPITSTNFSLGGGQVSDSGTGFFADPSNPIGTGAVPTLNGQPGNQPDLTNIAEGFTPFTGTVPAGNPAPSTGPNPEWGGPGPFFIGSNPQDNQNNGPLPIQGLWNPNTGTFDTSPQTGDQNAGLGPISFTFDPNTGSMVPAMATGLDPNALAAAEGFTGTQPNSAATPGAAAASSNQPTVPTAQGFNPSQQATPTTFSGQLVNSGSGGFNVASLLPMLFPGMDPSQITPQVLQDTMNRLRDQINRQVGGGNQGNQ